MFSDTKWTQQCVKIKVRLESVASGVGVQKRRRMGCEGIKEKETLAVAFVSVSVSDIGNGKEKCILCGGNICKADL